MRRATGAVAAAVPLATAAIVVLLASAAFSCTNLATITLSSEAGRPGDTILLTGTSFPVPRASSGREPTPVTLHWKEPDGPLLGTATPDRTGTIAIAFTVPDAPPGPAVIIAVQRRPLLDPNVPDAQPLGFADEYGTPARATLRVLAPGERLPQVLSPRSFGMAGGSSGDTAAIVMLVLFGAVALSLFCGGVIAFLHQMRARRPVPEPWRVH